MQESWFKAIYAVCRGVSPPDIVVVGTHLDGAKIDNYHNVVLNKYATLYPTIRFATAVRYLAFLLLCAAIESDLNFKTLLSVDWTAAASEVMTQQQSSETRSNKLLHKRSGTNTARSPHGMLCVAH